MKTRFAPSPTGHIHIGNARTALLSALAAYQAQGTFLLRIEDTDKARSTEAHIQELCEDLTWLGLSWQEGEGIGGPHQPYRQSARQKVYEHYYQELLKNDHAYPCYCSDEELELTRKLQIASSQAPRYPGTCRNLSEAERAAKVKEGRAPSLRFAVPKNKSIAFNDLVKGPQKFMSDDIGDFIIRRADGGSTFMFCNAIDDSLMEVTEVIRGEDHLANTPRQLMILTALNLRAPTYGHISLINGLDGSKLSKRNGSRSIRELRDIGFLSLALVNYLSRLGHYYESNDFMDLATLAKNFSTQHLGKAAAKYDEAQLLHWQKLAVLAAGQDILWSWLDSGLQDLVPANKKELALKIIRENAVFPDEAKFHIRTLLGEPELKSEALEVIKAAGTKFYEQAKAGVEQYGDDFAKVSAHITEQLGIKGKNLFQPLRLALTGQMHGPQMSDIFKLLGIDLLNTRLQAAEKLAK